MSERCVSTQRAQVVKEFIPTGECFDPAALSAQPLAFTVAKEKRIARNHRIIAAKTAMGNLLPV
jgi:hypothetical protein